MTTLTHIVTGAAVGKVVSRTTQSSLIFSIAFNIFISNLPDINLFWVKKIKNHHKDFTHYPFIALILVLFIFVIEKLTSSQLFFTLSFGLSLLLHYFADTFGQTIGIYWLIPFNYKEFSFTKLEKVEYADLKGFLKIFTKSAGFVIEILWNLICMMIIVIL